MIERGVPHTSFRKIMFGTALVDVMKCWTVLPIARHKVIFWIALHPDSGRFERCGVIGTTVAFTRTNRSHEQTIGSEGREIFVLEEPLKVASTSLGVWIAL